MRLPTCGTRVVLACAALCAILMSTGCGNDQVVGGPAIADTGGQGSDATLGDGLAGTDAGQDGTDAASVDAADGTDDGAVDSGADAATDDATPGDSSGTDDLGGDGGGATDDVATDGGGATDDVATDGGGATDDVATDGGGATDAGSVDVNGTDAGGTDASADVPACTKDDDCVALSGACQTGVCSTGTCTATPKADGSACDDGNACTTGDACGAGKCAGAAKVCDDANPCTDDSCAAGACVNAANTAGCDDGNACTGKDACKAGTCTGDAAAVNCDDASVCTTDSCDATVGCKHANTTAPCDDGSACTSGDACKDGKCAGGTTVACDDGNACTTDACDPKTGLCNFGSSPAGGACDDGDACTSGDACNQGKCKGTIKSCDDANPCTDDTCDAKTGCKSAVNSAACDDGNACTASDVCKGGTCAGAATVCDDGNPCTDDACDPKTGCTKANNTATCSLGNACQEAVCKAGTCTATGATKSCDDGNPCTEDSCKSDTGCKNVPATDGSNCAPGDACINPSTCSAGKCTVGAKANCDDGNPCTTDSCDPKTGCVWAPNSNPCDDGNACTIGDACALVPGKGPSCQPGKPIDLKTCDDANGCTDDKCDPAKGCVHGNNVATCSDGNVCTSGEACKDGKCQGGSLANCDDGKVCTTDQCDPATGNCSWSANTLACNDGNACTSGDACSGGKCAGPTAKVCDDGNVCTTDSCDPATGVCGSKAGPDGGVCNDGSACTSGDACAAGLCVGKPAVNCDDANVCTDDACDAKTGQCSHKSNTALCDDGDKCTAGDFCASGSCNTGKPIPCDDGNVCTKDSCDSGTGKCVNAALVDGTVCDDGIACTTESACKTGACTPKAACTFLKDSFACADAGKGWTLDKPASTVQGVERKVAWKVDQLAAVGSSTEQQAHQCSMNFNNDKNYCDAYQNDGQNLCLVPAGTAKSTVIDWTGLKVGGPGTPQLTLDAYYDVDASGFAGPSDVPQAIVRDSTNAAVLATFQLSKDAANMKVWRPALTFDMTPALGHKFTVEFSLYEPQFPTAQGNQGTGFYVDNVSVLLAFPAENCSDGVDNDGNGQTDCADAACASYIACSGIKLLYDDFACSDVAWTNASTDAKVGWAVDATPVGVKPVTGACTLNYNNGTDYNAVVNNASVINSGNATYSATVDATGLSQLLMTFYYYLDTETGNGSAGFDNAWVQFSTVDFTDCKDNLCTNAPGSKSFQLEKTNAAGGSIQKQWNKKTLSSTDLAAFAGKKFKVRFRFDTVDAQFNGFAGAFLDDVHLLGAK
jgi:hypothetical protein